MSDELPEVRKNVPMPKLYKNRYGLDRLKVDEMIFLPGANRKVAQGAANNFRARNKDKAFSVRQITLNIDGVDVEGYGIWRTK